MTTHNQTDAKDVPGTTTNATSSASTPNPDASKLSVIMIIQTFFPMIGGAEKQCLQLSKALTARGVTVKVLTEHWKGWLSFEEIEGIPVRRIGRGGPRLFHSFIFMAFISAYLIIRRKRYQVIHCHLAASHAVAASFIGKILGKKVFVKVGGGTKEGEFTQSHRTFFGRLKLRALGYLKPHLIILNEGQRENLGLFGLKHLPVTYIPNGVDVFLYDQSTPEEKQAIRKRLDWDGFIFLYVGRFSRDKLATSTLQTFLTGWKAAFHREKEVSLILIGEGPLETEYQNSIKELGLRENVRLIPPTHEIWKAYQAADVFVLPSLTEGLSNALLEAMASHLPVVASRIPGITNIIDENRQGFLFDPNSPTEIEVALKKIRINQNQLSSMGLQSREKAVEYSIENTVEKCISLYY